MSSVLELANLVTLLSSPLADYINGTKAYLEQHIHDSKLRAVLTSQWGTYGLPPEHSPFVVHALIVQHYLEGGYYPVGGTGTIATSVQAIVEAHGGQFLLNREVTQVIIEHDLAVGVRVRNLKNQSDETYEAPVIISDVGAANTYLKLIPADYPILFRESLRQFVQAAEIPTPITLYLGLSDDPRKLGFHGENHWNYTAWDHDATYRQRDQAIQALKPNHGYLSFPSLKDPNAKAHTAEMMTFVNYEQFAQWRDQQWRHRDEDYQALKAQLADAMIALVDQAYPGFANLVAFKELSTPITTEHFTDHPRGAIYGLPLGSDRFQRKNWDWTRPTTPLLGLYLTGADVCSFGIVGAMMGSIFTLSNLPDAISFPEVFRSAS
ncbi:phytoene desaturase family protein [Leptolyngbya sp. AN03gr2]|uniref:phytoene desaturase family protein n=1 Tax=unclassified Leptolyngbya TaxID=2650499 RepID=UPI003D315F60